MCVCLSTVLTHMHPCTRITPPPTHTYTHSAFGVLQNVLLTYGADRARFALEMVLLPSYTHTDTHADTHTNAHIALPVFSSGTVSGTVPPYTINTTHNTPNNPTNNATNNTPNTATNNVTSLGCAARRKLLDKLYPLMVKHDYKKMKSLLKTVRDK